MNAKSGKVSHTSAVFIK